MNRKQRLLNEIAERVAQVLMLESQDGVPFTKKHNPFTDGTLAKLKPYTEQGAYDYLRDLVVKARPGWSKEDISEFLNNFFEKDLIENADMKGVRVSGELWLSYHYSDFNESVFNNFKFKQEVKFNACDFSGAEIISGKGPCKFINCEFSHAILDGVSLIDSSFEGCAFFQTTFFVPNFYWVVDRKTFSDCFFDGTRFLIKDSKKDVTRDVYYHMAEMRARGNRFKDPEFEIRQEPHEKDDQGKDQQGANPTIISPNDYNEFFND